MATIRSLCSGHSTAAAPAPDMTARTRGRQRMIKEIVAGVGPLAGLPSTIIEDLADLTRIEEFEQGDVIYRMGEPNNHLWIVGQGCVLISCFSPSGGSLLRVVGQWGAFGEVLVSRRLQGRCQAHAHSDSRLYKLHESDLLRLSRSEPEFAIAVARLALDWWKQAQEELEDMVFLNARQRVVKLLGKLSRDGAHTGLTSHAPVLQFSQEELARLVGITREHINAIFREFERAGVIRIRPRSIRVYPENLQRVAAEEGLAGRDDLVR